MLPELKMMLSEDKLRNNPKKNNPNRNHLRKCLREVEEIDKWAGTTL